MAKKNPTTVYLDERIRRATKMKAAIAGKRVSDVVNEALARYLDQDAKYLKTFREREKDSIRSYEDVLADMKRDGLL